MNKLTVALVRPLIHNYINSQSAEGFESSIGLVPPLNLCCLAAAIEEAGFKVSIYDCEANNNSEKSFERFLSLQKPDVVGISIITTNFRGALITAKIARRLLPAARIVCGGTHLTIFPLETLFYPEFDFGFIGEAEKPFAQFLSLIERESSDFKKIPGLVWRNNGQININEPYGFNQELDSLPFPAYHLLDLSGYTMPNAKGRVISLFLSRGCPFSCGFCYRNPQLQRVRFKSVGRVIEEIEYMVREHDIHSINFIDETISLKKDYFLEFCNELSLRRLHLEWQSPTRVTSIDEDIVRAAKRAGCHTFRFGVESGSDVILGKINKAIDTAASRRAIGLCRKHGIKTVAYFIIGYLGETEQTIQETIAFAKSIKPDYAAFFPATPMPATELCKESEEEGLIPKGYWRDFILGKRSDPLPFIFPDAGRHVRYAYKQFYFSPAYILSQMKTMRFYKNLLRNIKIAFNFLFMRFKKGR